MPKSARFHRLISVAPIVPVPPPPIVAPPVPTPLPRPVILGPPIGGDPLRPPPPPPPVQVAPIFVRVSCAYATDPSDNCQKGVEQATDALTDKMAEEAVSGISVRMLKVNFPSFLNRAEQLKLLKDMEENAIAVMQAQLLSQLRRLTPWEQPLPRDVALAAIQQDERALDHINREARRQADSGENWTHQWPTHTFLGNTYNEDTSWKMSPALKHEYECAGAGHKPRYAAGTAAKMLIFSPSNSRQAHVVAPSGTVQARTGLCPLVPRCDRMEDNPP